jgi:phosphate starvation-inducible PhoH-like protein
MTRVSVPERGMETLFGNHDENLRFLETTFKVRIKSQGSDLLVEGDEQGAARVSQIFEQLKDLMKDGYSMSSGDVRLAADLFARDPDTHLRDYLMKSAVRGGKKVVVPRSLNQRVYLEQIEKHDMVFGIGPAGTGKTYLAVAQAVSYLLNKQVTRIILARPAVEAGEKLGFLPGDLQDKVDPYLRPLYDALYDLLDPQKVDKMLESNVIEVAPLAFMRGRTLSDAFIIMDEAQNTTTEQMKMFVTRLGNNSKAVITGDLTQTDLPNPKKSGLLEALNVLDGVEGIRFCHFEDVDVVRHHLVQRIVRAYDSFGRAQQQLPLTLGDATLPDAPIASPQPAKTVLKPQ